MKNPFPFIKGDAIFIFDFIFDQFFGHVFSGNNKTRKNRTPKKRSLHMEPLEDRQMLSVSPMQFDRFDALYPDGNAVAYDTGMYGNLDYSNVPLQRV